MGSEICMIDDAVSIRYAGYEKTNLYVGSLQMKGLPIEF